MADKGIHTPQYMSVQRNYARLIGHLQINKEDKKSLFNKFVSEGWHIPADCPSENDLINIALKKIEDNPSQYGVFIDMLEQISGTKDIVEDIKGTLHNCLSN